MGQCWRPKTKKRSSKTLCQQESYIKKLDIMIIPNDIIIEILIRLPLKSLLRFKCVCKSWLSTIKSHKFIEKHLQQNKEGHIPYMMENTDDQFKSFVSCYVWDLEIRRDLSLTNEFCLRSFATKEILHLPDISIEERSYITFYYLKSLRKNKVVYFFEKNGTRNGGCKILTAGIDDEWRTIDIPSLCNLGEMEDEYIHHRRCGGVYYFARFLMTTDPSSSSSDHHMVFVEIESESFGNIKIPHDELFFMDCKNNVGLIPWETTKLSLWTRLEQELHFWILEDYKIKKWADTKIVISLSFMTKHPIDDPLECSPWYVRKGAIEFLPCNESCLLRYEMKSHEDSFHLLPSSHFYYYSNYYSMMI